jgi:hypothetical protein
MKHFKIFFFILGFYGLRGLKSVQHFPYTTRSGLLSKLVVNQVNQLKADLAAIKNSL